MWTAIRSTSASMHMQRFRSLPSCRAALPCCTPSGGCNHGGKGDRENGVAGYWAMSCTLWQSLNECSDGHILKYSSSPNTGTAALQQVRAGLRTGHLHYCLYRRHHQLISGFIPIQEHTQKPGTSPCAALTSETQISCFIAKTLECVCRLLDDQLPCC